MRPANTIQMDLFRAKRQAKAPKLLRPAKRRPPPNDAPQLNYAATLAWMDARLATPLTKEHGWIVRGEPPGDLVCRFVLPLELCRSCNKRRFLGPNATPKQRRAVLGIAQAERGEVLQRLYSQWLLHGRKDDLPLPGRPFIRAVLFSRFEYDPEAGWDKLALDVLQLPGRRGMKRVGGVGLLKSDKGSRLGRLVWWEPCPDGCPEAMLLELWTGDPSVVFPKKRRRKP